MVRGGGGWRPVRTICTERAIDAPFGALESSTRHAQIWPGSARRCSGHFVALLGRMWIDRAERTNAPKAVRFAQPAEIARRDPHGGTPLTPLGRRAADLPVSSLLRATPFRAAATRNVAIPLGVASPIHRLSAARGTGLEICSGCFATLPRVSRTSEILALTFQISTKRQTHLFIIEKFSAVYVAKDVVDEVAIITPHLLRADHRTEHFEAVGDY